MGPVFFGSRKYTELPGGRIGRACRRAGALAALVALLAAASAAAQTWVTYPGDYRTMLLSRTGADGAAATANATEPSLSLDGRNLAFASAAPGLGPTGGQEQVFLRTVRERCTAESCACCRSLSASSNRTILVSLGDGVAGEPAAGAAGEPALSGSGWKVAFTSAAPNLGGRRGLSGVYLRNVRRGTTILVSRASGPRGAAANGASSEPSISADGNLVAFTSTATNLGGPRDGRAAVYVRDLSSNRTYLVSRWSNGRVLAAAEQPALAPGGGAVAFVSASPHSGTPAGVSQVYERDLRGGRTFLVSRADGRNGAAANADATRPSLDQNGSRVAFQSAASNLEPGATPHQNVYLRDVGAGRTWLVSRGFKHQMVPGPPANSASTQPSLSRDGRFICFQSAATNLGSGYGGEAQAGVENIFVYDTRSLGVFLISRASGQAGAPANGNSGEVSCSAGASLAAFSSAATNLEPGSPTGVVNVYRRTVFGGR
ncbi:MAG: PD40 domain-containing protein [Actinobacteria bacterium]|nr:PD40 domain-containing protein [Actinomycetota bacterium]